MDEGKRSKAHIRSSLTLNNLVIDVIRTQDSLLMVSSKQKKGIKSSIGRLFGKKEKGGRMEQTVGRDGQPLPALSGPLQTEILTIMLLCEVCVINRDINEYIFAVLQTLR